jgi:pSer/pThr/pTyr-binding forkhead associated (FHA) protein
LFNQDFKLNEWLDREGVPPPLLGAPRKGSVAIREVAYAGGTTAGATIMKPQPAMEAHLIPIADMAQAQQFSQEAILLSQTKIMTVGRQAGSYLLIDNDSISRRHAEISYANKQYVLRDLGSSNGTYVNEVRLQTDKVSILKPDDRVRFGKVKFRFQEQGVGSTEGTMTRLRSDTLSGKATSHHLTSGFSDPSRRDQSSPTTPSGQPILNADGSLLLPGATEAVSADIVATFKEGSALIAIVLGSPHVVQLKQGRRIVLGRDKACTIVLADVAASRRHAEVFPGPDGFYIRDLGSANGVIVNQVKIDNPYLLVQGDRIEIGGTVIFFMNLRQDERNSAIPSLFASLRVDSTKDLLNVCGHCGASNTGIARFCSTCGTPLETTDAVIKG